MCTADTPLPIPISLQVICSGISQSEKSYRRGCIALQMLLYRSCGSLFSSISSLHHEKLLYKIIYMGKSKGVHHGLHCLLNSEIYIFFSCGSLFSDVTPLHHDKHLCRIKLLIWERLRVYGRGCDTFQIMRYTQTSWPTVLLSLLFPDKPLCNFKLFIWIEFRVYTRGCTVRW